MYLVIFSIVSKACYCTKLKYNPHDINGVAQLRYIVYMYKEFVAQLPK